MLRDEIDYAEFRRRAVAARLARLGQGPQVPEVVIGQPASTERQEQLSRPGSNRGSEDCGTRAPFPVTLPGLSRVRSKPHGG